MNHQFAPGIFFLVGRPRRPPAESFTLDQIQISPTIVVDRARDLSRDPDFLSDTEYIVECRPRDSKRKAIYYYSISLSMKALHTTQN